MSQTNHAYHKTEGNDTNIIHSTDAFFYSTCEIVRIWYLKIVYLLENNI